MYKRVMDLFWTLAYQEGFFGVSPADGAFPSKDSRRLLRKAWDLVKSGDLGPPGNPGLPPLSIHPVLPRVAGGSNPWHLTYHRTA